MGVNRQLMWEMFRKNNINNFNGISIDDFGPSLLHAVANYPELLLQYIKSLPIDKRLAAIKTRNASGNTVLHSAATNPQSLQILSGFYSHHELLPALLERNNRGETVFHVAASSVKSWCFFSTVYSVDTFRAIAKEKDNYGNTILHHAVSSAPAVQALLGFYSRNELVHAIYQRNNKGDTVLHEAVPYKDSLAILWPFLSEKEQLRVLDMRNKDEDTIFLLSLHYPESLQELFRHLSEKNRIHAVNQGGKLGHDLFHWLSNPHAINVILNFFSCHQCLEFITRKDVMGNTLIEKLIHSPAQIQAIIKRFPETNNWQLFNQRNKLMPPFNDVFLLQQLLCLHVHIERLKELCLHPELQMNSDDSKKIRELIKELHHLVNAFIEAKSQSKYDTISHIKVQFKMRLEQAYKEMRTQGEFFWAILGNILIAATGIGLVLIAGMMLTTGTTFFMKSKRQQQAVMTNDLFQEMGINA